MTLFSDRRLLGTHGDLTFTLLVDPYLTLSVEENNGALERSDED